MSFGTRAEVKKPVLVRINGNLTADLRLNEKGNFAFMSVAWERAADPVSESGQKLPTFISVKIFDDAAEIAELMKRGDRVYVEAWQVEDPAPNELSDGYIYTMTFLDPCAEMNQARRERKKTA